MTAPAPEPFVSVVIETITTRENAPAGSPFDGLEETLAAVEAQTYPRERTEILVIVDADVPRAACEELQRRHPTVRLIPASAANYFAAKNAGAAAANGELVVLIDGDCVPERDLLEILVAGNPPAGGPGRPPRFTGGFPAARTVSRARLAHRPPPTGRAATPAPLHPQALLPQH